MEIKANELRIGNLIQLYRKPEDKQKTIHKIKSVFYSDVYKSYCVELKDGFIINFKKGIEPIPLTEEWLLKFGFKKRNKQDLDEDFNWIYELFTKEKKRKIIAFGKYKDELQTFLWSGDCMNHINHVHQLQNLYFALTGQELTIKH